MSTILFSLFDKTGLAEYAQQFTNWGWDILASGGTAKYLTEHGFAVQDVADLVGEPLLGHRVVTLSREVHAGLLAQDNQADRAELQRQDIPFIDALYVTLYPLLEELCDPNATLASVTEKTDIGGPTMLRSAAKGRRLVASNKRDMTLIVRHLMTTGGKPLAESNLRRSLAYKAERAVATYVLASAAALCTNADQCRKLSVAFESLADEPLEIHCDI